MSKTVLAQVDGFTPVIDAMIPEVGLLTAVVFGKVWRYCQMSDGVCKASQERISNELGLSRATVNTHLTRLCDTSYLKDLTPDALGVPHEYADTGKANLSISLTGFRSTCQFPLHPPVKQIDTKIVSKKQKEEIDIVAVRLSEKKFPLNANSATIIQGWRDDFPDQDDVILRAIDEAFSRGARSLNYIDRIILGWKADGVPPTRDEQKASRKNANPDRQPRSDSAPAPSYSAAELALIAQLAATD